MAKTFYLTTTLPYVNADPHIGFGLELVQADALARLKRRTGIEVFFTTGTDEHGQKIFEAAEKAGKDVHEYVDFYASEVQKLKSTLAISNDTFIRTTNPAHYRAAQEMWRRCEAAGDIYKKAYEGLYCVGCEKFLTEKEIIDEVCHIHKTQPRLLKEENYFFRLSNYQDRLREYLSHESVITPLWRREEALAFVEDGLEDFSISREKSRLSWGVPVPGDDTQVMYVWFDALTNYVSTLGWPDDAAGNFSKFWEQGETLQMAGKDQVRFQSIMWQAMLMSAGVKSTDRVFYHGFITSGGQKMSKSLGNVISPYQLVEKYGTDATRYMLLRHVHPVEDSDVTWERLDEWYTAGLVNGLGNLTSRIMQMASQYLDSPVEVTEAKDIPGVKSGIEQLEFNAALDALWSFITHLDELIQQQQPFRVVKENPAEAKQQVTHLVEELWRIAAELESLMPDTAAKVQACIRENKKPETLFPRLAS